MDPIQSISALRPAPSVEPTQDRSSRMIAEARRMLVQNKITGADATRVSAMLTMAEQSHTSGKVVDAQRIAREALQITKSYEEAFPGDSPDNQTDTAVTTISNDDKEKEGEQAASLPTGKAMGDEAGGLFDPDKTYYTDGSSDEGVSFQSEQPVSNIQAPLAVRQHELSHVRRDTDDAIINGQRVMASVTVRHRIDYETGKPYIAGGRAHIIIFPKKETPSMPAGQNVNLTG